MSVSKTYKVVSPFLGNNKTHTFDEILQEKDFIPGDLKNRINSGHVVIVPNEENPKKKGFFSKIK